MRVKHNGSWLCSCFVGKSQLVFAICNVDAIE